MHIQTLPFRHGRFKAATAPCSFVLQINVAGLQALLSDKEFTDWAMIGREVKEKETCLNFPKIFPTLNNFDA